VLALSCSVLDEEIVTNVPTEYYDTPEGCQAAVDAAYQPLRTYYGSEIGTALTVFGTDEYTNGGHGGYHYLNQYTSALNSAASTFWHVWSNFYIAINTCNTVIARSEQVTIDANAKNAMIGEARFLRAHYYFELV